MTGNYNYRSSASNKSGYTNYNVTVGYGVGVTAGVMVEDSSNKKHLYVGTGLVIKSGTSGSITHSSSKVTTGYSTAVQAQAGYAFQLSHNFGADIEKFGTDDSWSTESGYGWPRGVSLTGYWIF
ncbi:MAG: hypothetical protein HY776_00900 [Actinobacteria bacterium]|nr:hypothetical protein [Actinomycetota bacterium]